MENTQENKMPIPDVSIPGDLYYKLKYLGIIGENPCRTYNIGASDYPNHLIQPWSIWLDYPKLTSFDHDIIKRVLRTKPTEDRISDYKKIIHICEERIRQLNIKRNEIE